MFQHIINYVPITSVSANCAQGPPGSSIDFVPSDSFCIPGSRANAMESTLCKNSNLHEVLNKGYVLHGIPGNLCEGLQTNTLGLHTFGWPTLGSDSSTEGSLHDGMESSQHDTLSYWDFEFFAQNQVATCYGSFGFSYLGIFKRLASIGSWKVSYQAKCFWSSRLYSLVHCVSARIGFSRSEHQKRPGPPCKSCVCW